MTLEYKILTETKTSDLVKAVNKALADEWELQGGVTIGTVSGFTTSIVMMQAIVKVTG